MRPSPRNRTKPIPLSQRRLRLLTVEQLESRESPTDFLGSLPPFLLTSNLIALEGDLSPADDAARLDVLSFPSLAAAHELSDDGGRLRCVGGPVDVTAERLEPGRPLVEQGGQLGQDPGPEGAGR